MTSYTWVRVTNSQPVCTAPGYIGCIVLTDNGSGNADITLYDGESASDPQLLKVRTLQHSTKVIRFQPPLTTQRGLYVTVGSNVNEALIQHSWGPE